MREIKFRVWDKKNKKMLSWDDLINGKIDMKFYKDDLIYKIPLQDYFIDDNFEIMQYTGLKDKNGAEIYEGDIIHVKGTDYYQCIEYGFENIDDNYGFVKGYLIEYGPKEEWEVVGNIHQTPELIKE